MELLYKQECYDIVGAAIQVYNTLRNGFNEFIYQDALEIEFRKRGIPYQREVEVPVYYDGIKLDHYYKPDFVCYDKIVVELKALTELVDANRSQAIQYLKATDYRLALLLNFGNPERLEHERFIR